MEFGFSQRILNVLLCLTGILSLLSCSAGVARFTKVPSRVLYVSSGTTARFVWEYTVTNRQKEFADASPTWNIYDKTSGTAVQLAYENKSDRSHSIASSCPGRLRTRISNELIATLVISNVTTEDNGRYGCSLVFSMGVPSPIVDQVELVVTDRPQFSIHPPLSKALQEGQDLSIWCSAIGSPKPEVKWIINRGHFVQLKSVGLGETTLSISNIRREQSGTYECQATNNPNETPIKTTTTVSVQYRPIIDVATSTKSILSWDNHTIYLLCLVSGNPVPKVTWYRPTGRQIIYGVALVPEGGIVSVKPQSARDYGRYRCHAKNVVGDDQHFMTLNKLNFPGAPVITMSDSDISSSSLTVRWTRPVYDRGSRVIDYKVEVSTQQTREGITGTSVVISGLNKNTEYVVKVYARNVVGYGNKTIMVFTTKKEDHINTSYSCTTAVAICVPLIALLVVIIVLLVLHNWWNAKRRRNDVTVESLKSSESNDAKKPDIIAMEENKNECNASNSHNHNSCSENPKNECSNSRHTGQSRTTHRRRKLPLHILTPIAEEGFGEEILDENGSLQVTTIKNTEADINITVNNMNHEPIKEEEIAIESVA